MRPLIIGGMSITVAARSGKKSHKVVVLVEQDIWELLEKFKKEGGHPPDIIRAVLREFLPAVSVKR